MSPTSQRIRSDVKSIVIYLDLTHVIAVLSHGHSHHALIDADIHKLIHVYVYVIMQYSSVSWHLPDRFHEIEPQMGVLELLQPTQLARKVLGPPRSTVPYPLLRENTLVLSDRLVLRRLRGRMELQVRVGDVYPNQVPYTSLRKTRI